MRRSRFALFGLIVNIAVLLSLIAACQPKSIKETPTPESTATVLPTFTPTPAPFGSPENPLILASVAEDGSPQVASGLETLAQRLSERSGYSLRGLMYTSYKDLSKALEEGRVHLAWLPPLTYLYASQKGIAEPALLANRFGVYGYGVQFMANTASGFTPQFDPISGKNAVDAAAALAQFRGKRPCWVEPGSPSGYLVPAGLLKKNSISVLDGAYVQSHTAIVRALYVKGICDFGASFSITGDPRTSSAVLQDLPDAMQRIQIIWRSEPIIPNTNLSFLPGIPDKVRQPLIAAFLDIVKTPEGKAILTAAAGNYTIDDLKTTNDAAYNELRDLVKSLNVDLRDFIGK